MDAAVRAYQNVTKKDLRDKLVVENLEYVRHVLSRTARGLPYFVDVENLEAAGILGLVEAASSFDPHAGVEFRTYAHHRIRGAILDELRRNCPLPQQLLEQWARVRAAIERLGEQAGPDKLALATQLTEQQVEETLSAIRIAQPETWSEELSVVARGGDETSVSGDIEADEQKRQLAAAIEQLPDRLRIVLSLYYLEDLRLAEIGEVLSLSESRVSRLLARAQLQLKLILKQSSDGLPSESE